MLMAVTDRFAESGNIAAEKDASLIARRKCVKRRVVALTQKVAKLFTPPKTVIPFLSGNAHFVELTAS